MATLFDSLTCAPNLLGFGVRVIFHDGEFLDWGDTLSLLYPHYLIYYIHGYPQHLFLSSSAASFANLLFTYFQRDTSLLCAAFSAWSLHSIRSTPSLLGSICPLDNCVEIISQFLFTPPVPSLHFLCDVADSHFGSLDETYFFPLLSRN